MKKAATVLRLLLSALCSTYIAVGCNSIYIDATLLYIYTTRYES